jgi:hypothetical protein
MAIQYRDTVTLSQRELTELIDREARIRLKMSGEEFMRLYKAGKLPDKLAARDIAMLAKLAQ